MNGLFQGNSLCGLWVWGKFWVSEGLRVSVMNRRVFELSES